MNIQSKITTLTSREFNQDVGGAKRAAQQGPVFVTDRGRPAHVLLSIEEYNRLNLPNKKMSEMLAMPGGEDFDFDIPRLDERARAADFG